MTYEIEKSFNHYENGELMFRVKITHESGGVVYDVFTKNQVKALGLPLCPSCDEKPLYEAGRNALSRKDNKTEICSDCGQKEAIEEFLKYKSE